MGTSERIADLGITIPEARTPSANLKIAKRVGNTYFVSGHPPVAEDGTIISGKVGTDLTLEEGIAAGRSAGLQLLGTIRGLIGDLDQVDEIIKVFGMVNAAPDFTQHAQVINGCSDLFTDVFGERGQGARSAVGMGSLPLQMAVEIEIIFTVLP